MGESYAVAVSPSSSSLVVREAAWGIDTPHPICSLSLLMLPPVSRAHLYSRNKEAPDEALWWRCFNHITVIDVVLRDTRQMEKDEDDVEETKGDIQCGSFFQHWTIKHVLGEESKLQTWRIVWKDCQQHCRLWESISRTTWKMAAKIPQIKDYYKNAMYTCVFLFPSL